ncbi:NAD(P)/FAD-dependent oxidoreductase [Nocardioides sp.]|uniref:phytoene desaturase family protein n=1 Tax=Nocardioides sp. TaxID=35761 RepID=UPI002734EB97|nr:NAD(P)/FAD-dependent oxidoreductase [Nocardioides sp.]MDP3893963.1 NAD(P)/FAD-dependent oxidoreductase [Nocardioides sp.]
MTSSTHDAVVIGAGPNGLVAANHLADQGWSVLVLEAQPDVGGAVRSDRSVYPEFVHDTFSAFYPLAVASPTIAGFELERHGLRWREAPAVLGHPTPDGEWALLHRDRDVTADLMEKTHPGDGEAWLELCAEWDQVGRHVVGGLMSPFPPVRHGVGLLAKLHRVGGPEFVRTLLTPVDDLARRRFGGRAPHLLLAGNASHADIPMDAAGSGLMGLLLTMLGQTVGFPVPEGGAGRLTEALARRFVDRGGEIRCGAEAVGVDVERGRAVAVRTGDGHRAAAGRAVVATVGASSLYDGLVPTAALPRRVVRGMRNFALDPGTVKVDWALDGPVPWQSAPAYSPGTVHVSDSVAEMTQAFGQVHSGLVPADPFLLVGQMTQADPTRSPTGTESLWAYTHVPQSTVGDAGEEGIRGVWDRDDNERFADRMQARLERLAPGFGSRILARRVLGPREFEARDANLVGGAINGGTAQLHQQLVFRPVPGLGRAETGITNLYLGSASAHPGGGVHGAPGMNAARAAVVHARLRRLTGRARR